MKSIQIFILNAVAWIKYSPTVKGLNCAIYMPERRSLFFGIHGVFDSVDRNRLFECLAKFGMLEEFVVILKALCI